MNDDDGRSNPIFRFIIPEGRATAWNVVMTNSGPVILGLVVVAAIFVWAAARQSEQQALGKAQATASAQVALATQNAVATGESTTATAQAVEKAYERAVADMELEDWSAAYGALHAVYAEDPTYLDTTERMKIVIAALTPTATPTVTPHPTITPTSTPTQTPSPLPTETPTKTPLPTETLTPGPTTTPTQTLPPTSTPTITPTPNLDTVRVEAEGVGYAPAYESDPVRRERLAVLAAEADAKRYLAKWIEGEEVESVTLVADGAVSSDTIRLAIQAKLPPTETVNQSYDAASGEARVRVAMSVVASAGQE